MPSPMSSAGKRPYYWLTLAVSVISLLPLLLVRMETWDFVRIEMGFIRQDPFQFQVFKDHHYLRYLLLVATNELSLFTGLPAKLITNALAVLSVLGIARESFVLLRNKFDFSFLPAMAGAWVVLAFPAWHTLVSGAVLSYALFLWIFLASINLWDKKRRIIATGLFLISLAYYSIFAMVVGFACCQTILTINTSNARDKLIRTFLFCLGMFLWFIVVYAFGDIRTHDEENAFSLHRLHSFINFGAMAAIVGAGSFLLSRTVTNAEERAVFTRRILCLLTLAFFAGLAYWAVGKPLRFFAFGSYTARHTFLTCIPLGLGMAIAVDLALRKLNGRIVAYAITFVLAVMLVLQHQGLSHKAAELIYREIITQEFKKISPPPSGYVAIFPVGFTQPRHVHKLGLAMSLYRAYGKTAWMLNDPFMRDLTPTEENMIAMYKDYSRDEMKKNMADEVTGDAYTKFELHLENYYQEGRFWYWWYYAIGDYTAFNPRLVKA